MNTAGERHKTKSWYEPTLIFPNEREKLRMGPPAQCLFSGNIKTNLPASFSTLRGWRGTLVIALLVGAGDYWAGFEELLHQEFVAAAGALLGNRLVGRRK